VDVHFYSFLNLALDLVEWTASRSAHFIPRERVPDARGTKAKVDGHQSRPELLGEVKSFVPAANRTYISRLSRSLAYHTNARGVHYMEETETNIAGGNIKTGIRRAGNF
jgi:hypothetical protein